ncbi:DUF1206 domain-containing protein [Antarcticibacterium flavum]|uniref:DUF1206 domain-containing protein n=1 Tax=Antarcticibacterium flavum TaxID=2058175 RepID=A0A5B7X0H9_9FLAO|nr:MULTISPECIES: DUF1206 domain-containing protein [Antarcticibacterium]MCM4160781.1 hypothetical protein [Antarcticibacterium sp. W02-3]QCY68745.1 DUF1206 domain-containing protein [Antarcticibacterium flavum]
MGKNKEKTFFIHYLPIYGSFSTGLIYGAIGVIAILSFLRLKDGGADESSLMAYLNDYLLGKILIGIILMGTLSYIIWRIYESYKDPYNYGSNWKGIMRRTGIGLSSIADVLIAYSAIVILIGNSNVREDGVPAEEREMVGSMLSENWGDWVVVSIGVIIILTALVQFFYGITRGYKERLSIKHFNGKLKMLINILAWAGYFARGFIIGIIGFFFIKAGILENPNYIVNTDKAFNFIGENIGHFFFILVAVGTICYGAFMFFLGYTYNIEDRDNPLIST